MRKLSLLLAGLVLGCGQGERGPIVLITIDTLRADHAGARLTPHLNRLASEATWAGRAITPSDNGVNHFSYVEGDRQLLWESHFAKPEPGNPPTLTLWSWTESGSGRIEDARQTAEMARRLKRAWIAANGPEKPFDRRPALTAITKQEEQELRSLGYIH